MTRMTARQIVDKKGQEKIVMLTAYDYPLAAWIDRCGVDIILVGDSLANVVLGLDSTREVDMEIMLHHTRAVNRAVHNALLIGDMPYGSYQTGPDAALANARRFVDEAGCGAVKIEWFDGCLPVVQQIAGAGIPVMGHVGLTPQTVQSPDGFKVKGKDAESARRIIAQARALEEAGCFSVVLECVPDRLAARMTGMLRIPTIGIGAGVACDGQVLVAHDLLGLFDRYHPKFVRQYANLGEMIVRGVEAFREDVRQGRFPDPGHSYSMTDEEWRILEQDDTAKPGKK